MTMSMPARTAWYRKAECIAFGAGMTAAEVDQLFINAEGIFRAAQRGRSRS